MTFRLPIYRFDKQRAKCLQCLNCETRPDAASGSSNAKILHCIDGRHGAKSSCSLERSDTGGCGPKATKFKPRDACSA